jgi:hypothetical protein
MRFFRKTLAFALTAALLFSAFSVNILGASFTDTAGHWAERGINALAEKGIVSARGDNKFEPDANILRAELFVMLNNAFDFTAEATINFSDAKEGDWFYPAVRKAVAAGYITGYEDNTIRPNGFVTRNEAAVIITKVLSLPAAQGSAEKFADAAQIPTWALPYVESVVSAGFMGGYPNGTFGPARNETRAEAVSLVSLAMSYNEARYNAPAQALQQAGDIAISKNYGPASGTTVIEGNASITADGITVKNITVKGDLIIEAASGTGTITLSNVKVDGKIIVKSANSITYSGNANAVEYGAAGGTFRFVSGEIASFNVTGDAQGSKFYIEKDAVIKVLDVYAPSTFEGRGEVSQVMLHVNNVSASAGLFKSFAQGSLRARALAAGSSGTSGGSGINVPFAPGIPPADTDSEEPGDTDSEEPTDTDTDSEEPLPEPAEFNAHVVADDAYLVPVGKKGIIVFVKENNTIISSITEDEASEYVVTYIAEDGTKNSVSYDSDKGTFYAEVTEVEGKADSYYSGKIVVEKK